MTSEMPALEDSAGQLADLGAGEIQQISQKSLFNRRKEVIPGKGDGNGTKELE